MIKVSVLYPNKPGSHFDMNYYVTQHMPLAMRLLKKGLRKTEADAGIQGAAPGVPAAFYGGCQGNTGRYSALHRRGAPHPVQRSEALHLARPGSHGRVQILRRHVTHALGRLRLGRSVPVVRQPRIDLR